MSLSVPVSQLPSVRNTEPVIVLFFAHGCTYCQKMMPEWEKFKKTSPITFSEVPAEQMVEYNPIVGEDNITGYPTLRLYNKGKLVKEYDGDRSKKDIMKFIKKYVKKTNTNKKNLLLVKAKKGNSLNKKMIKKLTQKLKERKRMKRKRTSKKGKK